MKDFTELYSLLGACYFSFKRSASSALNQGCTRGLTIDDVILVESFNKDNEANIQTLAKRTNRDIASVSRQITSLCAHGWVTKRRNDEDARERMVAPTLSSEKAMPEAREQIQRVYKAATSRLSPTEQEELCRMLRIIAEP